MNVYNRAQGLQPADFDPATYPIIARHWFGLEPFPQPGDAVSVVVTGHNHRPQAGFLSAPTHEARL